MAAAYFPSDLHADLRRFGLEYAAVPTSLGTLRVARSRSDAPVDTLFLHGVGLDSAAWSPLVEAVGGPPPAGWAFLDLPGFGASDPLAHHLTLDQAAAAVLDVLDHLGATRVHLVGHSMGGFLALHLAATRSERVSRLTVVCGAYGTIVDVVNTPLRTLRRAPQTAVVYLGLILLARLGAAGTTLLRLAARTGLLRLTLPGVAAHPLRVRSSLLRAMAEGNRPRSFRYAQATGHGYDYRATWSRITAPVLAIYGRSDALVTARDAAVLSGAVPTATTHVLDDAAHLAPMEQPAAVLRLAFPGLR